MSASDQSFDQTQLATPALVIDLPTVEKNLQRMAQYCAEHGLNLRPHTKTHKSRQMAQRQLAVGAAGLTVAKLGEAQVMAQVCDDLLVAYPSADPHRAEGMAQLAREHRLRVAIDSSVAADALNRAAKEAGSVIGVLVDVDTGHHRTGLQEPGEAVALAQHVQACASLRFDGLFTFPGHIVQAPSAQGEALGRVAERLQSTLDALASHDIEAPIVSGGSTPTALQSHMMPQFTEIRPGTYIYHDWNCVSAGWCALEDCAAQIVCTVVSDAVPHKIVVDAGSKTLTSDRLVTDPEHGGHGHVMECPEARIVRLSEEHGEIAWPADTARPSIGTRLHIIPNHICPCVNLQDQCWLRHADGAIERMQVHARGRVV